MRANKRFDKFAGSKFDRSKSDPGGVKGRKPGIILHQI